MKKLLLLSVVLVGFQAQAQFWTAKATGFATASRGINGISIVDDNVVWAKSYDGSGGGGHSHDITRSTDGGNTWTTATVAGIGLTAPTDIGSISAVSATTAWVSVNPTADGGVNGIWKTTNSGTSWTKQTTAPFNTADSFADLVYMWDANNGIAVGDPATDTSKFEIYTTTNGGTTWVRLPAASIPDSEPVGGEYGYTNNYAVSGNSLWFGTSSGRLFRTNDMGMTWTVSQAPLADFGGALSGSYSFSDTNKGLLVLTDGTLFSTVDGATTWTPVVANGTVFVGDIAYVPGTSKAVSTGIGATAVNGVGSSYTLDDGVTWTTTDTTTQYGTVRFLNENTGFAGGFNTNATTGGIYKYTGTELPVAHFNQATMAVYPNPSNGIVAVTGITVKDISVVDMLGKQVFHNKYNELNDSVNVDLTSLQTGVYMMTVTNEAGMAKTVKIMKN